MLTPLERIIDALKKGCAVAVGEKWPVPVRKL
jgi:hypothetical protein